jgi:hypothetical protein
VGVLSVIEYPDVQVTVTEITGLTCQTLLAEIVVLILKVHVPG